LSPGPITRGVCSAVAAAAACLLAATPASAQQPAAPPGAESASEALANAAATLDPGAGDPPQVDASVAMNELAAALPQLEGTQRVRARSLLARPTDGAADQFRDGYPPGAPIAFAASDHFCVYWVADPSRSDAPALTDVGGEIGIPDYPEAILAIAERSYAIEVAPGALGWAPPRPDTQGCGEDPAARADIYLKQLGDVGLFGYEAPDPGQGRNRSQYGYIVLDNDYDRAEYGYGDPLLPAQVTVAHEFNHLLQQNYDSFQDVWMFESTATWAEELVYPEVNDYLGYVRAFAGSPGAPITKREAARGLRVYGAAVWNHWLSGPGGGYGVDAVRRAWEVSGVVQPADFAIAAYDRAIRGAGGRRFGREFLAFSAATAEWRTGFGGFPDAALYPDVKRKGKLRAGARREFRLDHTAMRMIDVRAGGGRPIKLTVRAPDGLRSGLALVARRGDQTGGEVRSKAEYLDRGRRGSVTLDDPGRFKRITAVIVNADGRVDRFVGADWEYRRDDQRLSARLSR
jgi:hypothetical protein